MQKHEARAWIIEDSPSKQERLGDLVTENGGTIAYVTGTVKDSIDAVTAADFPGSMGNPNVVLIDQELLTNVEQQSIKGPGGHNIFTAGDRIGVLRRPDEPEIGIVAFGTSSDPDAKVVESTGVHFLPRDPGQAGLEWEQLLQPHPADSETAPHGSMVRKRFESFPAAEMLRVLQGENKIHETVTLQALMHSQDVQGSEQRQVTGAPVGKQIDVSGQDGSLVSLIQGGEGIRQAVVTTPTDLVVIRHTILPTTAQDIFGPKLLRRGRSDHIPLARVQDLPRGYWQSIGFNPKGLHK